MDSAELGKSSVSLTAKQIKESNRQNAFNETSADFDTLTHILWFLSMISVRCSRSIKAGSPAVAWRRKRRPGS
jgi:hypothetical protein